MEQKDFTLIRKDVLNDKTLSLGAKGLYCLISYDLTTSLRELLSDPRTEAETIDYINELSNHGYADFDGFYEGPKKDSFISLDISIFSNEE